MHEIILNLHMHTGYSDGYATHAEIARAGMLAGLDAVIVTDHNVWVNGPERYYKDGERKILLMVGEEIHDQTREPQQNHLLVFGAGREMATHAHDPQRLLDTIRQAGGLSFAAHPNDPAVPAFGEAGIPWEAWDLQGLTGLELWNGITEFKERIKKGRLHAAYYAFRPWRIARGPLPETLQKWDELLSEGSRWVAIGGSDAHAMPFRVGPFTRTLFTLSFHFRSINTHVFVPQPLSGDALDDSRAILESLRRGWAFIGYDLPAPTRGFRFSAQGSEGQAWMGDEVRLQNGVTLQVRLPKRTECRLLRNGVVIKTWRTRETCTYITTEPGVYRTEVYLHAFGRRRGWIYSNPIYIR